MMNRILAIARLTLRAAVRSKALILLISMVLGGILLLPLILKHDGTLAGQIRLLLSYGFGLVIILLSVAALWAGAGAVSLEVEGRQIQLTVVKPVHTLEIWFGKWLGVMALNVILLGVAGLTLAGVLLHAIHAARVKMADLDWTAGTMTAYHHILPRDPIPNRTIAPGQTLSWHFNLPQNIADDEPMLLRFSLMSSRPDLLEPVPLHWQVKAAGSETTLAAFAAPALINKEYRVPMRVPTHCQSLQLSCLNAEQHRPITVVFPASDSVKILSGAGSFADNFLRALLMILARLAFFSALGLTTGIFFSFPVATFVSVSILIISAAGNWLRVAMMVGLQAENWSTLDLSDKLLNLTFKTLLRVMPDLDRWNAVGFLADDHLIAWRLLAESWGLFFGIYVVLLALIGAWWLKRRELGMPTLD